MVLENLACAILHKVMQLVGPSVTVEARTIVPYNVEPQNLNMCFKFRGMFSQKSNCPGSLLRGFDIAMLCANLVGICQIEGPFTA